MLKTIQTIITSTGGTDLNSIVLGTSGNIIITSAIIQTAGTGGVAFENSSSEVMVTQTVSGQVVDALVEDSPVFMLSNTLRIVTQGFNNGDIINILIYYHDGSTTNPLFTGSLKLASTATQTSSLVPATILQNNTVDKINIKSIYVFTDSTTNSILLTLQTAVFVAPVQITPSYTGLNGYQMKYSPLLLEPSDTLIINMTEAVDTRVFVSYTQVAQ